MTMMQMVKFGLPMLHDELAGGEISWYWHSVNSSPRVLSRWSSSSWLLQLSLNITETNNDENLHLYPIIIIIFPIRSIAVPPEGLCPILGQSRMSVKLTSARCSSTWWWWQWWWWHYHNVCQLYSYSSARHLGMAMMIVLTIMTMEIKRMQKVQRNTDIQGHGK